MSAESGSSAARWLRRDVEDVACEIPEEFRPAGPVATVRVKPLDDVDLGLWLLGQRSPVYCADKEDREDAEDGEATVVEFQQWDTPGSVHERAMLSLCITSRRHPEAVVVWPGGSPEARLTVGDDGRLLRIDVARTAKHVVAVEPSVRGPLDADGIQCWLEPHAVARLPTPEAIESPPCMVRRRGLVTRWRRRWRPMGPRDCCDYHRVDWVEASRLAIELAARARTETSGGARAVAGQMAVYLGEMFPGPGVPHDQSDAVRSLGMPAIHPGRGIASHDYQNGRHRVVAMIDQGVRVTLIERLESGREIVSGQREARRAD